MPTVDELLVGTLHAVLATLAGLAIVSVVTAAFVGLWWSCRRVGEVLCVEGDDNDKRFVGFFAIILGVLLLVLCWTLGNELIFGVMKK